MRSTQFEVYFSHPDPADNTALVPDILKLVGGNVNLTGRDHLTLWTSDDDGDSFSVEALVDADAAGYSSLQVAPTADGDCEIVYLLYEQADPEPQTAAALTAEAFIGGLAVLDPDRFVLQKLEVCS